MVVFDDGTGPALYVGGVFSTIGGIEANNIARWNGLFWSPLVSTAPVGGGGVGGGTNGRVNALVVFDDGSGPALYAGGTFTLAGGRPASRVVRWDGTTWSKLSFGLDGSCQAMAVFDDGSGEALYVGGGFTAASGLPASRVARWDGTSWSPLEAGVNGQVNAMAVYDDGTGPSLYVGGFFNNAGGVPASRIARWDGASWFPLGNEINGADDTVFALIVFDDGTGAALYVGGDFSTAGGSAAARIARWDGADWSALAFGLNGAVRAMTVFRQPLGTTDGLFVGGDFNSAGLVFTRHVGVWDGSSWSPVGFGLQNAVHVLGRFDDGVIPLLFAGSTGFGGGNDGLFRWGPPVPLVTNQPSDQKIEVHEPAIFSLSATSAPGPMMIQWRKDGQPLLENPPRITGTQTTTLRIDPAGLADAGVYDAVLTNVCGAAGSNRAVLTVTCYADCDQSTGSGVLDIFDFLCFQDAFVGFSPYADCDGDGLLNIFDFLCFQNAFTAGCI
jgi:Immunoglobulin domain